MSEKRWNFLVFVNSDRYDSDKRSFKRSIVTTWLSDKSERSDGCCRFGPQQRMQMLRRFALCWGPITDWETNSQLLICETFAGCTHFRKTMTGSGIASIALMLWCRYCPHWLWDQTLGNAILGVSCNCFRVIQLCLSNWFPDTNIIAYILLERNKIFILLRSFRLGIFYKIGVLLRVGS